MRRVTALLLAGLLTLTISACGEEPPAAVSDPLPTVSETPAEPKPFALAYDPEAGLHPIRDTGRVNRVLVPLVYEGLYGLDGTFAPQPVLAQGAEVSDDGLVWTVTLKEGVCFSDGTALTAGHAADSLNAARKSTLYGERLSDVRSVRAVDGAVIITLTRPNGALPALLDVPVVLEVGGAAPLGTGRYRYAETDGGLTLMINYNSGGTLPYGEIPLVPVTTTGETVAAFDAGRYSAAVADLSSAYTPGYSCSYEAWDYATPDLIYVGFRTYSGPCADPSVRRAVSCAADRLSMVKEDLSGRGDGAVLPIHPAHSEYSASAGLEYDPAAAAALLEDAGYVRIGEGGLRYRGSKVLAFTLLVNSDNAAKTAMARRLAEQLQALGAEVTLRSLPWKDYLSALSRGEFDLYIGEVRMTGDFDPTELLSGSLNYGGYAGWELLNALDGWRAASGEERAAAAEAFWTEFAGEMPVAALCFKQESLLVRWDTVRSISPIWGDPFHGMEYWEPVTEP